MIDNVIRPERRVEPAKPAVEGQFLANFFSMQLPIPIPLKIQKAGAISRPLLSCIQL
jgi:hypothetical protein